MAFERKKRKIKIDVPRSKVKEKELKNNDVPDDTEEKAADTKPSKIEIIKGSRRRKRIIRIISYALIVTFIVTLLVVNSLSATGLVETLQNAYAKSGSGKFPVSIYSQNSTSVLTVNNTVCALNDSYFEVYNRKGKLIQAASHGMSDPVLEISEARFLLYDRSRYTVKTYNYSSFLAEKTFDKPIFAAAIGRSGTYAVVTSSDSYYATVYVYNKNNDLIYTWNSANYYVADVAVSNDGNAIALALLGASGGTFVSEVYILRFDSATPKYKFTFDTLISSLMSAGENYMLATGIDSAYTVAWDGSSSSNLNVSGVIRSFMTYESGWSALTCGRENNDQINSVKIIGQNGMPISDFEFFSQIDGVGINAAEVIILSDQTVCVYDHSGNLKSELTSDVKPLHALITQSGDIITVDNSRMQLLSAAE